MEDLRFAAESKTVEDLRLAADTQRALKFKKAVDAQHAADVRRAADVQSAADLKKAADVKRAANLKKAAELQHAADVKKAAEFKRAAEFLKAADCRHAVQELEAAESCRAAADKMAADAAEEAAYTKSYHARRLFGEVIDAAGSPRVAAQCALAKRIREADYKAAEEINTAADVEDAADRLKAAVIRAHADKKIVAECCAATLKPASVCRFDAEKEAAAFYLSNVDAYYASVYDNAELLDADTLDFVLSLRLAAESHTEKGSEARMRLGCCGYEIIPDDVREAVRAWAPEAARRLAAEDRKFAGLKAVDRRRRR